MGTWETPSPDRLSVPLGLRAGFAVDLGARVGWDLSKDTIPPKMMTVFTVAGLLFRIK